jgi:DNA modification methylase
VSPEKYVEWFLPRSEQFLRVLKPTGTFVLNIKEKLVSFNSGVGDSIISK